MKRTPKKRAGAYRRLAEACGLLRRALRMIGPCDHKYIDCDEIGCLGGPWRMDLEVFLGQPLLKPAGKKAPMLARRQGDERGEGVRGVQTP